MEWVAALAILFAFGLGFAIGYVTAPVYRPPAPEKPVSFFSHQRSSAAAAPTSRPIVMDESKVVVGTDTSGMQRNPAAELGKTTTSVDDINSSVSRLSKLKKDT